MLRLRYRLLFTPLLALGGLLGLANCSDDEEPKETCVSQAEHCKGFVCADLAPGTCVEDEDGDRLGTVGMDAGRLVDEDGKVLSSQTETSPEADAGVPPPDDDDDDNDDDDPPLDMSETDDALGDCAPMGATCPAGSICKESVVRADRGFAATFFCVPEDEALAEGEACESWSISMRDSTVVVDPCRNGLLCAPNKPGFTGPDTTYSCQPDCFNSPCEDPAKICVETVADAFEIQTSYPVCLEPTLCDLPTQQSCEEGLGCVPEQDGWSLRLVGSCENVGTQPLGSECNPDDDCGPGALCLLEIDGVTGSLVSSVCTSFCGIDEASLTADADGGVPESSGCSEGQQCLPLAVDNNNVPLPKDESQSALPGFCVPDRSADPDTMMMPMMAP